MEPRLTLGGCRCGAVRYAAAGQPYHVTHCHCSDCRRSSGAPFVTWASFARGDFRWLTAPPREAAWAGRRRAFCPDCGTALTLLDGADATEIDVTVGSFDEPTGVTPADHTWTEDRLAWITLADGLPAYARQRPPTPGS